jgi:curved DNA-binding protein CbpA
MTKDYYRILDVQQGADEAVIRAAYKVLAQKYHPDKWVGNQEDANARMSDINEAYAVLSDPEKRSKYDLGRKEPNQNTRPQSNTESSNLFKKNKWMPNKRLSMGGALVIVLGIYIGFIYESGPITTFNALTLGETREEVEFKFGKLSKETESARAFLVKDTRTYVYLTKDNKVDAIAYICTDNDSTKLSKIKCGDTSDTVKKILGKSLIILCEAKPKDGADPTRSYSSEKYGIKVVLSKNSVQVLGILNTSDLVDPKNEYWESCR